MSRCCRLETDLRKAAFAAVPSLDRAPSAWCEKQKERERQLVEGLKDGVTIIWIAKGCPHCVGMVRQNAKEKVSPGIEPGFPEIPMGYQNLK